MRIRPRGELRRQVNFYSSWLEIYDSTNSGVCLSYLVTLDFLQNQLSPLEYYLNKVYVILISERIFNLVPTSKKYKIHFHIKGQSYLVNCKFLSSYSQCFHYPSPYSGVAYFARARIEKTQSHPIPSLGRRA